MKISKWKTITFLAYFVLVCSCNTVKEEINGIAFDEINGCSTIENEFVRLSYDLNSGYYSLLNKKENILAVDSAFFTVDSLNTLDYISRKSTHLQEYKGASLIITNTKSNLPDAIIKFTLNPENNFVLIVAGVSNTTRDTLHIKKISPIASARIFKGLDISNNLCILDGNGGGEPTTMKHKPMVTSQNNILIYFEAGDKSHSLTMGGITYGEYQKFAQIGSSIPRKEELIAQAFNDMELLSYLDLGIHTKSTDAQTLEVVRGSKYTLTHDTCYPEAKSVVWDEKEIHLDVSNLLKDQMYSLGLVWVDDGGKRKESVWAQIGNDSTTRVEIFKSRFLPDINKGETSETAYFRIPLEISNTGKARIVIKKDEGINAVASEIILYKGKVFTSHWGKAFPVKTMRTFDKNPSISLYAQDPVGKRVDPGAEYLPVNDRFYIDIVTGNPFEGLEQYGQTLKKEQKIKLPYYYFPSICLWYAMEPRYGGVGTKATNDSPGAVAEMQRVNDSGWLKYTTMAIRLVPDCYAENNENGWWDDEHWRMHGSGKQHPGMALKGAHYREPYETSKKWAEAVTALGGIPLTYFQTAVRSKDYAEKYPEHMLFNQSFYDVGEWDYFNKGFSTYDFTDKGFSSHMNDVYKNLKEAGIKGLMYDYPDTGWADYGGMDDKYCTVGSHYRRIYQLAKDGLDDGCYLHERNLARGSDITLGIVASQRTWGDTDIVTPEMLSRTGLRWYKNRTVISYDMDAKNLIKVSPNNQRGLEKMLTMCYTVGGRLLLANSFSMLNSEQIYALSRVFPFHSIDLSARPIDMLQNNYPKHYVFRINDDWTQLVLYNQNDKNNEEHQVSLGESEVKGGLALDKNSRYHIFDFWNNKYLGIVNGSKVLDQLLDAGEARVLSIRKVMQYPQIISTDRHILQGYLELTGINWDTAKKSLSGEAQLIKGEPMKIMIAKNGFSPSNTISFVQNKLVDKGDYFELELISPQGGKTKWEISFQ